MAVEDTVETVAIIGAGIGGIYLAAELGIAGFKLRLHDIDDSKAFRHPSLRRHRCRG